MIIHNRIDQLFKENTFATTAELGEALMLPRWSQRKRGINHALKAHGIPVVWVAQNRWARDDS